MSLKLRCPACGHEDGLPEFTRAEELLALDRAAAAFGDNWPLARAYLECFRGKRPLKAARLLVLVEDLLKIYRSGQFEFNRSPYLVGRQEFLEALRDTVHRVTPPLTNHHYLLRVLMAAAQDTSKRREREFKGREQGLGDRDQEEIPRSAGVSPAGGRDARPTPPFSKGGEEGGPEQAWREEFDRLVVVSLDMSRSKNERMEAKDKMRQMSRARNARDVKPMQPSKSPRKQFEDEVNLSIQQEQKRTAKEILQKAGLLEPSEEDISKIYALLDDPEWTQKVNELIKQEYKARMPGAKAEAQAALRAHLEGGNGE